MRSFHWIDAATASISATSSTGSTAILKRPNTGAFQVRIHNTGTATVFVSKGGSSVTAAVTDLPIPSGAVEVLTILNADKDPVTHIAAITTSGTATVYVTTGSGI